MTEKVVSLSGGLVLGMAFALFLSVSTTQTMNAPMHVEYPSVSNLIGLNDLQSYRSSGSGNANDTTPAISVAPPAQGEDRGRIVRIATVTETTDPVLTAPSSQTVFIPKSFGTENADESRGSTLQQMHQQHTHVAQTATGNYSAVQIARQSGNFTSIANSGRNTGNLSSAGGSQPSVVDSKPQTSGSPAVAHNDPGQEGEEEPAVAGFSPRPSEPDQLNDNDRRHVDPYNPQWQHDFDGTEEGGHHPDPHGIEGSQQGHRPETD